MPLLKFQPSYITKVVAAMGGAPVCWNSSLCIHPVMECFMLKEVGHQISQARRKIVWMFSLAYHDTARSLHPLQSPNFDTQICWANATRDAAWSLIITWINEQAVHHNVQNSRCLPCKNWWNQLKSYGLEPKIGFKRTGSLARRRD